MTILSFILFLLIAAACAYIAEAIVPGAIPGGFFTSAVVGVIGAWIGSCMVGNIGPEVAGIPLISCILGSAVLVFLLSLLGRTFYKKPTGQP
jgi:uncharacterized membrane protein YeaQ/YmgE (transglycosylase-associated protein family)